MVHLDVKKVGQIPDGGGWRIHGRDSDQAKVASRAKSAGAKRGYVYLHSVVDGFSRLAYTEPLGDEKGTTAAAFLTRAKVRFAAHGINHTHRVVTDNGACYRSGDFARIIGQGTRHQRTKPRKSSTPASSPVRMPGQPRSQCGTSTTTTTGRIVLPPESRQQHASARASPTSSPHTARSRRPP